MIAHSMGTYCLSEALKNSSSGLNNLTQLALAAPDIEEEEFIFKYSSILNNTFNNVTIYSSPSDKALKGSEFINSTARLGDSSKLVTVINGMDTVDAPNNSQKTLSLNHSYIFEYNSVITDIHGFLINKLQPESRRLSSMKNEENKTYWKIKG